MSTTIKSMIFLLLSLYCLSSCQPANDDAPADDQGQQNPFITVNVESIPQPRRVSLPASPEAYANIIPTLSYADADGIWNDITLLGENEYLSIPADVLTELTLEYNPGVYLKYYLSPGDSVRLSYENEIPTLSFINPPSRPVIPNLDLLLMDSLQTPLYRQRDRLQNNIAHFNYDFANGTPQDHQQQLKEFSTQLEKLAAAETQNERDLLKNLLNAQKISEPEYTQRNRELDLTQIASGNNLVSDTIIRRLRAYQDYLGRVERAHFERGIQFNYKYVRNAASELGNDWIFHLRRQLTRQLDGFARDKGKVVLAEYLNLTKDTAYHQHLTKKFQYDRSISDDLILVNIKGDTTSWERLLPALKDSLVYVDFWASWCAPCRNKMPVLQQLRIDYSRQPLTVIYLSIDEDANRWQIATTEEKLNGYQHSYLAVNAKSSVLTKPITRIPYYILTSPANKLTVRPAPHPGSVELKELIDRQLPF